MLTITNRNLIGMMWTLTAEMKLQPRVTRSINYHIKSTSWTSFCLHHFNGVFHNSWRLTVAAFAPQQWLVRSVNICIICEEDDDGRTTKFLDILPLTPSCFSIPKNRPSYGDIFMVPTSPVIFPSTDGKPTSGRRLAAYSDIRLAYSKMQRHAHKRAKELTTPS